MEMKKKWKLFRFKFGIFRKNTKSKNNGPSFLNVTPALAPLPSGGLASLIHQTDKHGKSKTMVSNDTTSTATPPKGLSKLFGNLCSTLGFPKEQITTELSKPRSTLNVHAPSYPPPGPAAALVSLSPTYSNGHLGGIHPQDVGKKCLVLDLDETLVHSSFKPTLNPDYIIPVEIEGTVHNVYVAKRPGVDEFMQVMAQHYEIVIYTASLSKYANPLLDQLEGENKIKTIRHRLFREHCVKFQGAYVKDLSTLDRDLSQTIIIDNSAMSYVFHPQNAIGCTSFIDCLKDNELASIQDFLIQIKDTNDVREHLHRWSPQYAIVG